VSLDGDLVAITRICSDVGPINGQTVILDDLHKNPRFRTENHSGVDRFGAGNSQAAMIERDAQVRQFAKRGGRLQTSRSASHMLAPLSAVECTARGNAHFSRGRMTRRASPRLAQGFC